MYDIENVIYRSVSVLPFCCYTIYFPLLYHLSPHIYFPNQTKNHSKPALLSQECVAGLFLVYSLLHLQPYKRFAKLRITPADLDAIHSLEDMARRQRRYDVLYILGSLMIGGYVEFHIADREYGIESSMRKAFDGEFLCLLRIDMFERFLF